jgi:tRNA 2-thiouridine synthesizing protein A
VAQLETIKADKVVDARGTSCPGPLLEIKKGITTVPVGGVLEILTSDSGTKADAPIWCSKVGHEFIGIISEPGYDRILIRRKK